MNKLSEDIQYLFSKINWQQSFLDAKANQILNTFSNRIGDLEDRLIESEDRLLNGREYLMQIETDRIRIEDVFVAFGFSENGLLP